MSIAECLRTNLKAYREAAQLTHSELARRSGVSRAYLWQIEHGASVPTIEIAEMLAMGLGITIETLLGLDGKVPKLRLEEQQYAWLQQHGSADVLEVDREGITIRATYHSPMYKAKEKYE